MKFESLFILAWLLAPGAIAQEANCMFVTRFVGGQLVYACELSVDNPNGLAITSVTGNHTDNLNDTHVIGVLRGSGSFNTTLPGIFCDKFPNVARFSLNNFGITGITTESFANCSNLLSVSVNLNRIDSISVGAFVNNRNLTYIDFEGNQLSVLANNTFINQQWMTSLDIRDNPFTDIQPDAFRGLTALVDLHMQSARVTTINPAWFTDLRSLNRLYFNHNPIRQINESVFANLPALRMLSLFNTSLESFTDAAFMNLPNLINLNLGSNSLTQLKERSFEALTGLQTLTLSDNPLISLSNGSFICLSDLRGLYLNSCSITDIDTGAFEGLTSLTTLDIGFNNIEQFVGGVFSPLESMTYLGMWNNRIRFLRRVNFGADLSKLTIIDLESNDVDALERSIFEDAVYLKILYFSNNKCESGTFSNFFANRDYFMGRLSECFSNFYDVDNFDTDNNLKYIFHTGYYPGFVARVQAEDEIHIALTPFNFLWKPSIEIIIGAANNTRSIVMMNQKEQMAVVPTPGIINIGEQNIFRVAWAHRVVSVYREAEVYPFLVFSMVEMYNVRFYGVRTPESRATWNVQPMTHK